MFNVAVHYVLNLRPEQQSLCRRTIERSIALFREDDLAQEILHDVTAELMTLLELDVSEQRLDSTHLESNRAKFCRIRVTGRERLRVRDQPAVFLSVLLKVADWNLLRAASVRSLLEKLAKSGATGPLGPLLLRFRPPRQVRPDNSGGLTFDLGPSGLQPTRAAKAHASAFVARVINWR